ncbi:isocitrate lyase/phosphoenolpyruvate mutase family protein [Streptomyces griseoluteus]|uniref:Isocitrate lyase/phosphoenolpyruvate mutase family protein n=1 Tax=Streptomyces griseoluteus TaxID=29306 RepID=A0A4Z1DKC9_STRGP|nr:isocitrate lyase/phosphoenolpyruvate mutase family protein [Streptomyces griseoluteus]TGN84599.1 isocitrate lyase/phosphoenolpyruvate mutase family protein [Streptomyces griseoluteus]GHE99884.1 carboxyvinyl-carboxyphosphonate phosphorylmutase [Streptomyces griseoluteus]
MSSRTRTEEFRELHRRPEPGDPLVIPNVWDAVSARVFADAGHRVLATSSAAVAAVLGYDDGGVAPADEVFEALARIIRAVDVPVTVDIEDGYRLAPARIVERLLGVGAVGCNLEDTDHASGKLKDAREHAGWLGEFVAAAEGRVVLNARVDTFLHGASDAEEAISRGRLYAEAGADVVYPILAPADLLPELAKGVPAPLNALYLPNGPAPAELGRLGAARVTFGGGLHQRAEAALTEIARTLPA